jgi:hypothetical protein
MNFNFQQDCNGIISIIGGSEINKKTKEDSILLGRLLAQNNYIVACGGLGGTMEAVCRGAKKANGLTIGIIPGENKRMANKYVDIVIPVPFSHGRNMIVVLTGDIIVAIGGKAGTLSEISFSWIYEKPIIALTSTSGWAAKLANKRIDNRRSDVIYGVKTPEKVIEKIKEIFTSKQSF